MRNKRPGGQMAKTRKMQFVVEGELAVRAGIPVLGGPKEDDSVRQRLAARRIPGSQVLAEARAKLGLD